MDVREETAGILETIERLAIIIGKIIGTVVVRIAVRTIARIPVRIVITEIPGIITAKIGTPEITKLIITTVKIIPATIPTLDATIPQSREKINIAERLI